MTSATDDPGPVEFLPARHPLQRTSRVVRSNLIHAQRSVIYRSFGDASDFCRRVISDIKLSLRIPAELKDVPATSVSDLPYAELCSLFRGWVIAAGAPESAAGLHAVNIAQRAQLLRAFDDPDTILDWARVKVLDVIAKDMPKTARDIERGRNPGDVLDPYLLAATQSLLCQGDFHMAIGATVAHKALAILEGLMGHLHEEIISRMRGNVRGPQPHGENAERLDFQSNPFPGADVVQPPYGADAPLRLHQIKSKTGTLNSSGGKRLAEQMRVLRMAYPGAELYSHSLVGNTLSGHRSMGGMRRAEPALIVLVGDASFSVLTGSGNGAELLLRLYQNAFRMAGEAADYNLSDMTGLIFDSFRSRAEQAGEGYLETVLHDVIRGNPADQDSRTYSGRRRVVND